MTLSGCGKSTGKPGWALSGGGCYPNTEASKLLMDRVLLCKGMMNRVLCPGWDELAGGVRMGLCPSPFHRPLLAVPLLLSALPV